METADRIYNVADKVKEVVLIKKIIVIAVGIAVLVSCQDEANKATEPGGGSNLKVSFSGTSTSRTYPPRLLFQFKKEDECLKNPECSKNTECVNECLSRINGEVEIFSDQECTVNVNRIATEYPTTFLRDKLSSFWTMPIAPEPGMFFTEYYAQYTNIEDGIASQCLGPVTGTIEETPSLSFIAAVSPETPVFMVSNLILRYGTVQLFSDSQCTITASDAVTVSKNNLGRESIRAYALAEHGYYNFYAKHVDLSGEEGDCIGPAGYGFSR